MARCFALDCSHMGVCKCFELDSKKENCRFLDNENCTHRSEECGNYIPEDNPF